MRSRGKSLTFEDDEIDDLTEMKYGDKRTFSLLSLIFTHLNLRQHFHVDHIYPQSMFKRTILRDHDFSEHEIDQLIDLDPSNRLPNLQLLEGHENLRKQKMLPENWLLDEYDSEQDINYYKTVHLLQDLPNSLKKFEVCYEVRRLRLRKRLNELLR